MADTQQIQFKQINLDFQNPRLSEFGIDSKSTEDEILQILWDEMAVNEIVYSVVSNGFWDYEPLIVIENDAKYVCVEGNRRLAAIKLIHDSRGINIPKHLTEKISKNLLSETDKLPCIVIDKREDAWKFIGFKHVNGPAKWGSFAKAKYIGQVHNEYGISIKDIAYQIGDTHKMAQKLYQGLMVLEQANSLGVFDYDDIQANRIYFSHLYTGLQREGIIKYLKIKNAEEENKNPVPIDRKKELGQLLEWMFGSKKNEKPSVIKSQNPDLKYLDEVLQNKEATHALLAGEPLTYAHELSRASDALFEENILAAKRGLQKARAYLSIGYGGEEQLLKVAGSVAKLSDDLYNEMLKVYTGKLKKEHDDRITE